MTHENVTWFLLGVIVMGSIILILGMLFKTRVVIDRYESRGVPSGIEFLHNGECVLSLTWDEVRKADDFAAEMFKDDFSTELAEKKDDDEQH